MLPTLRLPLLMMLTRLVVVAVSVSAEVVPSSSIVALAATVAVTPVPTTDEPVALIRIVPPPTASPPPVARDELPLIASVPLLVLFKVPPGTLVAPVTVSVVPEATSMAAVAVAAALTVRLDTDWLVPALKIAEAVPVGLMVRAPGPTTPPELVAKVPMMTVVPPV